MKRLLFSLTVATLVSCGRTFEQRTAKYAEVGSVNDNRAAVLDINEGVGRWGYVDGTGRLVIECRYADARSFDDGLAAVQEPEGLWGYIDTAGRAVVAPQFTVASSGAVSTKRGKPSFPAFIPRSANPMNVAGCVFCATVNGASCAKTARW